MHSSRISAALVLLFASALANAQQAPAAAGAPGRGGRGFGSTQPESIDLADTTGWTFMFDGVSLQIEGPGEVSFRNLWIKPTSPF